MANKRIIFGLIIAACSLGIYSFVADDPIARIKQQLDKWTTERPVEKVYLHLDKPYYAAGDDIWFKAYVTQGSYNQLTTLSGIVNVELIDLRGAITRSLKLPLKNGVAAGDIALPDTLAQGTYRIRAYTNYMRNAGAEYFFDKSINIINTISRYAPKATDNLAAQKSLQANVTQAQTDVQFFPESGSLIAGVPTKVAFKALAPNRLGVDVTGVIKDNNGKQVATFASAHLGMGAFTFTPASGVIYKATIAGADGTIVNSALPRVLDRGYVLSVADADERSLQVKLAASRTLVNEGAEVTLVAQVAGKIYYSGKVKPGAQVTIPKNSVPTGIVHFTIFSQTGEPLNERLAFVRNADRLDLSVSTGKPTYAPREKVNLNISAMSRGNKPAMGSFSVSVIDETKVPVDENSENNILAQLLLTSDLKGYIEQPAYYFNNVTDKTRADLDLLMLTQGYSRFEWKEIMNNRFAPMAFQPERSLQVSGTITTLSGKPVVGGKVQLIDFDDISYTMDTLTDARGRFNFSNLAFEDSIRFIVQARNEKNKRDVIIKMDSIGKPATAGYAPGMLEINISDRLSAYAQSSKELYAAQLRYGVGNHVISLQEVVIREKKQALKYSANLNGPGNADQILLARDLRNMACIRLADCLQGRLLGVVFRNGVPYSTRSYNRPMQVILDGNYVDAGFLNTINYFDVQAIEVLRNAGSVGIYGGRGGSGVLIITTKRGDEPEPYTGPRSGRGIKALYPTGYYKARSFYSPQYDKPKENKQLADLRTTIYWNADVRIGVDGKTTLNYFNAGSKGSYRVLIEGIDADGNIGRQVYRYKVE